MSKPGFTPKFPFAVAKRTFFSAPLCHIEVRKRSLATDDTGNASRPLFPLRDGDRTEQTCLAADFSGADARLPGAVRAGDGGALQADRHRLLRQSRPQRADRRGARYR